MADAQDLKSWVLNRTCRVSGWSASGTNCHKPDNLTLEDLWKRDEAFWQRLCWWRWTRFWELRSSGRSAESASLLGTNMGDTLASDRSVHGMAATESAAGVGCGHQKS